LLLFNIPFFVFVVVVAVVVVADDVFVFVVVDVVVVLLPFFSRLVYSPLSRGALCLSVLFFSTEDCWGVSK
jgi:hypothetical protein